MHTTDDARLALTCMLGLLATLALARMGEARFRTLPAVVRAAPAPVPHEGNALRDGQRIDVNVATAEELALLPGVGPKLAQQIVELRDRDGPFGELAALRRVRGLGAKTLVKITPWLRVASERLEHAAEP